MHVATVIVHGGARLAIAARGRSILVASRWSRRCLSTSSRWSRRHDLSQVKRAFDLNGWVGILYFVTTGLALYVR